MSNPFNELLLIMLKLRTSFILVVLFTLCSVSYAAPRKRSAAAKPVLAWVKDNSKLFTVQQAEALNAKIQSFKDSVKTLPAIYVVTQNDYSIKSPFFRAIKSSVAEDKWYISEGKEYADDFVILIRPRSRLFTSPQLNILCNRNSPFIAPFISSLKIDRLQNEYNKYLNDAPNTAQSEIIEKLISTLRSRFFDGQIRDYSNVISVQDEVEIARFIQDFQDSTHVKVAMVTTDNGDNEDSVFLRLLESRNDDKKSEKYQTIVEYKNLNADIVFVFYPKGIKVFSTIGKDKLSGKAIQSLTSDFALPSAKSGKYKQAMQESLRALSDHLNDETPLDGMSIWEKLGAVLLGAGIPAAFGWYIFKDSMRKKKAKASNSKPVVNKPVVEKKPVQSRSTKPMVQKPITHTTPSTTSEKAEKKDEKVHSKPTPPAPEVVMRKIPPLTLTKPTEVGEDRGWTLDNTGSLAVTMSRIDDLFKPISPRNEHEKVMLEMIGYMLSLREYPDQEIAHSLGNVGVSLYLDELYGYVDPAAVRIVFNRGLDLLLKNYAERDPRVSKYITTGRH